MKLTSTRYKKESENKTKKPIFNLNKAKMEKVIYVITKRKNTQETFKKKEKKT